MAPWWFLLALGGVAWIAPGSANAQSSTSPRCPGEPGYVHQNDPGDHARPGGFVAHSADVHKDAHVAPTAAVCGSAIVESGARISGNALIRGEAVIAGSARVFGDAVVEGNATVTGKVRVSGHAIVSGDAVVKGSAVVRGYSRIAQGTLTRGVHAAEQSKEEIAAKEKLERDRAAEVERKAREAKLAAELRVAADRKRALEAAQREAQRRQDESRLKLLAASSTTVTPFKGSTYYETGRYFIREPAYQLYLDLHPLQRCSYRLTLEMKDYRDGGWDKWEKTYDIRGSQVVDVEKHWKPNFIFLHFAQSLPEFELTKRGKNYALLVPIPDRDQAAILKAWREEIALCRPPTIRAQGVLRANTPKAHPVALQLGKTNLAAADQQTLLEELRGSKAALTACLKTTMNGRASTGDYGLVLRWSQARGHRLDMTLSGKVASLPANWQLDSSTRALFVGALRGSTAFPVATNNMAMRQLAKCVLGPVLRGFSVTSKNADWNAIVPVSLQ